MRALMAAAFLFGAATAAQGQDMPSITEALQRNFPERHAELAGKLAGETHANARQVVSETMDRFLEDYRADIVAAPGPRLIAVEADAGRMLRALGRQDMAFCAVVGDRGFFSPEALDGAPPPGLDDYGAALIEAAAAGRGRAAPQKAALEDVTDWLAHVARREPGIPVKDFLSDRELRRTASDAQLCGGAAVMHEAVSDLPAESAARMAAMLVGAQLQ